MTSPYLEQPFVPLGVALPQMLESIEAELAHENLEPAHKSRLRHRAQVIHWLLVPQVTLTSRSQTGARRGSRSSGVGGLASRANR